MTDFKSLNASDFDSEVQAKITLNVADPVKVSALLNDYKHKLQIEDAAQNVFKNTAETSIQTINSFKRNLTLHTSYIKNEMLTLHDANPSDFNALHMTSRDVVLALSPLLFIQLDTDNINGGYVSDNDVITSVTDFASNATLTVVGTINYMTNLRNSHGLS